MRTGPKRSIVAKAGSATHTAHRARIAFPIVGVGASAGGLASFERLLKRLPASSGLAFVFIQHLDPTHESQLTELLARVTALTVSEAREGMRVQPNALYTIPPNRSMRLSNGVLRLLPRRRSAAAHLPIDMFFRSLADERGEAAIGVLLSGTASDGTAGLKAIKAGGGITFAEDAASAKYFDMPGNAIAAGAVDFILPPEEIAKRLAELKDHSYVRAVYAEHRPGLSVETETPFEVLLRLLKKSFGVDFANYKVSTIDRRIRRRMALQTIDQLEDYVQRVRNHPEELRALFQDMFIGVTEFFRDPGMFKVLSKVVFPKLVKNRPADLPIRMWVPGCSTGEEVYSIAISLLEYLGNDPSKMSIQIFGTDVNDAAISKARLGMYGKEIVASVGSARLHRFFTESDGGFQISKPVRDLCVFAKHNILKDPPFTHLDLLSCRNLLIYFNAEVQKRLIPMFNYALRLNGFLLLGPEETIGDFGDLFALKDRRYKLYSTKAAKFRPIFDLQTERSVSPIPSVPLGKQPTARSDFDLRKEAADQLILNHYGPPAVLVNENMEIVHTRGHTGPYLELAPGVATLNLLKMAREGLLQPLRASFERARKLGAAVSEQGVRIQAGGREKVVTIHVMPIRIPGSAERTFLVLFEDVSPSVKLQETTTAPRKNVVEKSSGEDNIRVSQLRQELTTTKAYLHSVIEHQESSNEELRSLNEEITSTNEELRSTTEELETANEELRSSNEELNTLNEESQRRSRELSQANDDILNLLANMNLSVIILDRHLCVRRFTPTAQRALHLVASDVGRPLKHLRLPVNLPDLEATIRSTMQRLKPFQADLRDEKGRLYMVQVHPYITAEKRVEGALVALSDVSAVEERFQIMADLLPEAITYVGPDNRYVFANSTFEEWFGLPREKVRGISVERVQGGTIYKSLQPSIERALGGHRSEFEGYLSYKRSGKRYVHIDYVPRRDASNKIIGYYSVKRDLTELKEAEEKFRVFVETAPFAIIIHDALGKMVVVNSQTEQMFGYPRKELIGQSVELLMPERFRRAHVGERKTYMQHPVIRPMAAGLELYAQRKDGSEFPVEISLSPIRISKGILVSSTIVDLTDRRRLAEQTHLATVLEERARLARDVHDTLAQGFTGIILNLEAVEELSQNLPQELKIRIEKAQEVAREKLQEARQSLLALSAPHRGAGDLSKSIHELADRASLSGKPVVRFSLRGTPRPLEPVVEENLLFVARQAIDNAQQHAGADNIRVELAFRKRTLRLRIQDDGHGFDTSKISRGLGLVGMRDRAQFIGGTFTLQTQPRKGTLIEVKVPFARPVRLKVHQ